jgi:hypothetical protein
LSQEKQGIKFKWPKKNSRSHVVQLSNLEEEEFPKVQISHQVCGGTIAKICNVAPTLKNKFKKQIQNVTVYNSLNYKKFCCPYSLIIPKRIRKKICK